MIDLKPTYNLDCEIDLPGSKYVANRVILIAALAEGISTIKNIPKNNDINQLIKVLKEFGVKIETTEPGKLKIYGCSGLLKNPGKEINVSESGTLMRFITSVALLAEGEVMINGSERIRERPIQDLLDGLNQLGAECVSLNDNFPPIKVKGEIKGGVTIIKGNVSSQFISSLLLTAPFAKKEVIINISSRIVSSDYINMTIEAMKHFGVEIEREMDRFIVKPQKYQSREFNIPGDWSSASYFLAAAAIIPGKVTIRNLDMNSRQGEKKFADILEEMGCEVVKGDDHVTVRGRKLKAVEKDMGDMPDVVQTLASVAVFAEGRTRITNIKHLKYKECDRIERTAEELRKLGVKIETKEDELIIYGNSRNIRPATFDTHKDHRMAMSLSLIGLKIPGIKIRNPEVAGKSFPNYWEKLREIGVNVIDHNKTSPDKTLLCIPIVSSSFQEASEDLKEAEKSADITELRLDLIKDLDETKLESLLEARSKPVIATYRGRGEDKNKFLEKAVSLGVEYIDIEFEEERLIEEIVKNKRKTKVIISHHDFEKTPKIEELENIYNNIKKDHPDLIKVVTKANSINDNFTIFNLLKDKKDLISFCMGEEGKMSRILSGKYGSCVTFCSSDENKISAPGQLTVKEMKNVFNFDKINQDTEVIGIIGSDAEKTSSKHIHNKWFKEKNLDFVFIDFRIKEKEELEDFVSNIRKYGIKGVAVTVPHKEEVMKYLDEIDKTAAKIGAVNTIINKGGKLIGYNTDHYGAMEALKEKTEIAGKKVLIAGAGGAARAIIYGLKDEGAQMTVVNRTFEKAERLAEEFEIKAKDIKEIDQLARENDVIINTTSVGTFPDERSIIAEFSSGRIVMDIVYKPRLTSFLKLAERDNCETITGDRMLVHQARKQFKLWTDEDIDDREFLWGNI